MNSLGSLAKRLLKVATPEPFVRRWHAFRWPYRWVRWLPGSSLHYGPARRWICSADYVLRHSGERREVLPAQSLPTPQFVLGNEIPSRFFERLQHEIPAAHVLRLSSVRLVGDEGWIIGARDSFLLDASYHVRPDAWMDLNEHAMLRRRRARPVRRLTGRTLSLASDFAEALIRSTNIPPERILGGDSTTDFWCEDLTATTFPGLPAHLTSSYVDFLRRRFSPVPQGYGRRLYLARAGFRRNFKNVSEIEAVLNRAGYEICLPHLDVNVLAKCAAATHIVALEGSNFFNAFAAQPGTRALLILPDAGQTLPFTLSLATAAGFETHLLAARSLVENAEEPTSANVYLDPALLARTLDRMERRL